MFIHYTEQLHRQTLLPSQINEKSITSTALTAHKRKSVAELDSSQLKQMQNDKSSKQEEDNCYNFDL